MKKVVSRHPEVMGGTPCFAGTRVPIHTLVDYLKAGDTVDDFLDGFPTVKREQVDALLKGSEDDGLSELDRRVIEQGALDALDEPGSEQTS